MVIDHAAVMAIRPVPRLIEGSMVPADQNAVAEWIRRNTDALIDFWDGKIDTIQLGARLVKV